MNTHSIRTPLLRKSILGGLFPLVCAAGTAAAAPAPATQPAAPCACHGTVYSVINAALDRGAFNYFLNEKGQVAAGSSLNDTNSFFDGDRLVPIRPLNVDPRGFTTITGLNNRGVVVGETIDLVEPFGDYFHFVWTQAGGTRPLPGRLPGQVWGINDRNQIVGDVQLPGIVARAARFELNGTYLPLGPLPFSFSSGRAIANTGLTGGFTDYPDGTLHATVWSAGGALTDLGTLGGRRAFTNHVNERGEAAGTSDLASGERDVGFFWSRAGGMVPIGAQWGGSRTVADLNDRGDVVGVTRTAQLAPGIAYHWTRGRGLVPLPRAGAPESDVVDINNRGEMVGAVGPVGNTRAVLWRGLTAPVDLNKRLHRIPEGLVLSNAFAINDSGTILAYSNAGLVLLRPGNKGTDAPVLGPLVGLPDIVTVGQEVSLRLSFIDNAANQVHTATADWGDSCVSPSPLVREAWGRGEVSLQHRFCEVGARILVLRVTDSGGRTTEIRHLVQVNPAGPALSGSGKLSGAGTAAAGSAQPLRFTLWAPLGRAQGRGQAQAAEALVSLQGPFAFRSDSVLVTRNGAQARLEGTGLYNGRAGYRFLVDALDAGRGGTDRMRVRISHRGPEGAEVVDYDSAAGPQAGSAAMAAAGATDGMRDVEGAIELGN